MLDAKAGKWGAHFQFPVGRLLGDCVSWPVRQPRVVVAGRPAAAWRVGL